MKKYKGFTLIELLVVIAIIAILASIILVSLNSAREKGKDTRVIADVQQTRTGIATGGSSGGAGYPDLEPVGGLGGGAQTDAAGPSLPLAPPLPICRVPALMVVPPE